MIAYWIAAAVSLLSMLALAMSCSEPPQPAPPREPAPVAQPNPGRHRLTREPVWRRLARWTRQQKANNAPHWRFA